MMRLGLALVAFLLLATPGAASAGVHVSRPSADTVKAEDVSTAANSVQVTRTADTITITDAAGGVTADQGCDVAGSTVTCPAGGVTRVELLLGRGDDTVAPPAGQIRVEMHGEEGEDVLHDGPANDLLDGGAQDDELRMLAGSDEVIGGDGAMDLLDYSSSSQGVAVTLPDSGTTADNGAPGEDDIVHADVEAVAGADTGVDTIVGNEQPNSLTGDNVTGAGGGDDLTVTGGTADAGAGNDFIHADNDVEETSLDCGTGTNDRIDADNDLDHYPSTCDVIAPELDGVPTLFDNNPVVGGFVHVDLPDITGGPIDAFSIDWIRCSEASCTTVSSGNVGTYGFTEADFLHDVFARLVVSNGAGGDEADSRGTGPITRLSAPPPPEPPIVFPPLGPYGDPYGDPYGEYGDYGDYFDAIQRRIAQLRRIVRRGLGPLVRTFGDRDPRRFAGAPAIPHAFKFPEDGRIKFTWTVPGGTGARAAARKPVVLARGTARGKKGARRSVRVKTTKRGRALLRRSRTLSVTLGATFTGASTANAPAKARRSFRLRRRG